MPILKATINDALLISQLACKTFYDTFTGTCTDEDMQHFLQECYSIEATAKELANPEIYYYIAFENNEPTGYMKFKEDNTAFEDLKQFKAVELYRLYVDKPFHGKGSGTTINAGLF